MGSPRARVAVIVPTHNYGRFLSDALTSLQAQTYSAWECIVVDDGSTDDTAEILADFRSRDERIRSIRRDHAGVSAARNAGLATTSAEFVQFLDSDDLLEPEKLAAHVAYLDANPAVGIVFGDVATFGSQPGAGAPVPLDLGPPTGRGHVIVERLAIRNSLVIHAPMTRRSVVNDVGVFAEDLVVLEDWEFWMRCALANVAFARETTPNSRALIRMHALSATRDRHRILDATVELRQRFERLALSTPARTFNMRSLARGTVKLALADLRRARIRKSAAGIVRAVPPLIRSYRFGAISSGQAPPPLDPGQ